MSSSNNSSCGPWKGISITLIILGVIGIIVLLILYFGKYITIGKPVCPGPTQQQIYDELKKGYMVTGPNNTMTRIQILDDQMGVRIALVSAIKDIKDIGGDQLTYRVLPSTSSMTAGVYYLINDTVTSKIISIDPKMNVGP